MSPSAGRAGRSRRRAAATADYKVAGVQSHTGTEAAQNAARDVSNVGTEQQIVTLTNQVAALQKQVAAMQAQIEMLMTHTHVLGRIVVSQ
jgi:phage I-like protein